MSIKYFLDQNYEKIKADCLKSNKLFVDDKFPADKSSISNKSNDGEHFQWKRPKDIVSNPQFIVGSIQPTDLDQGQIGNCWFISALSALANNQELVNLVVPQDQSFEQNYAGIFRFRFWNYGEWVEVVVDDHLPTKNNQLTFCRNLKDQNEIFGPLLEKAYAKLNKCYFNLISGEIIDALIDLTGGVHEHFDIKTFLKDPKKGKNLLWNTILSSFETKSMIGCAIDPRIEVQEGNTQNFLASGHAYTILNANEIIHENNKNFQLRKSSREDVKNKDTIKLLKLRNPWGLDFNYTGKWCLNANEWNQISNSIKNELNYKDQTDGQFFIAYEDFTKYFDFMDIVHVNLNAFYGPSNLCYSPIKWISNQFYGAWVPGVNSGGCESCEDIYWTNPQYVIELQLRNNIDQYVSIIVSLMQTETLEKREQTGSYSGSREAIGFYIYKIKDEKAVTDKSKPIHPTNLTLADSVGSYMHQREISKRCDLLPGSYVIVPSCFQIDVAMKFLLRVFIEGELETVQKSLQLFDLNKKTSEIIQENKNTNKVNDQTDLKNSQDKKPNQTPRDSKELNKKENISYKEKEKIVNPSKTDMHEKKKEGDKKPSKMNENDKKDQKDHDSKIDKFTDNVFHNPNKNEIKDESINKDQKRTNDFEDNNRTVNEPSDEAFSKYMNSLSDYQKNTVNYDSNNQEKNLAIGGRVSSTTCLLM